MRVQVYELNLISPDLRREEAIIQIADALDHIKAITDDIFVTIQSRVTEYSKRLKSVCDRADLAQKKIDRIKEHNKATKVFSSYKYPGAETLDAYKALFPLNRKFKQQNSTTRIKSKHVTPDEKIFKEKLQFYNVRIPEREKERDQMMEEGLGSLPKQLDSLSTLLLFNTAENPYKKYVILDPLGAITKTRKSLEEEETQNGLGAAPVTISHRVQLEAIDKENYFYVPGLGQVPDMDVPMALPDLPGIAVDLSYSADMGPSIAPSLEIVSSNILPDLPSLVPETPIAPEAPSIPNSNAPSQPNSLPIVPNQAPPPPPPPPPMATPVTSPTTESSTSDTISPEKEEKQVTGAPPPVANAGDARANLLESIRQAGGKAKLRSVADRKIEAKKKKQEEKTVTSTGDLMSDLTRKLQMRRKGISGNYRSESDAAPTVVSPEATLGKMSALIPPPPTVPSAATDSDDDGNNDDDDWD